MTPEEILSRAPTALSPEQRAFYFDRGYLHLEGFIGGDWLARLRAATAEMIERSRAVAASNDVFVLESGHSAAAPRLRRLNCAADHHPTYWQYASESIVPDIVADLVGADVKFREAMVNFKWSGGGDDIHWHQDIAFYPHTNMTPLITLLALDDVTADMGPLEVVPGSHRGPMLEHFDTDGKWIGRVCDADLERVAVRNAVSLTGPAGSLTVIHGATIHGSARNHSGRHRPLLVCGYSSADAFCYTALGTVSRYTWRVVRGQPAKFAHHEPLRLRVPPDWSHGYTSIFEDQKGEARASERAG